ncbi:hypothetical protein BDB00DRAFT_815522 [Zychaea mexicana]|uniref:uncharacterized protein n=1 Tax=Zychaea mexicana TaxID=64656 RepID=UPI0022FDBCE4|nr:uncharacterized protein BDB00DRAFT_815522 [Zychaea mexicana]KAI9495020.1 hypothetical protein BDB00DRAFT_815522 [Zychaea mexicana]
MLKNLTRIKQWTGERLGASKPTLQTEDLQELEDQLDTWHEGFEQMYQTIKLSHAQLSKTKTLIQESRTKHTPLSAIGDAWLTHGSEIAGSSPKLGAALSNLGEAEMNIAVYFDQLTLQLGTDYLTLLRDSRACYHKIVELRRKLETRRLDYAAHLSRLQKAKKEKPQLEQLLHQSKMKYEETQRDLLTKMIELEQFKEMHRDALHDFMDLQIGCFLKAAKILQDVKDDWPLGPEYDDDNTSSLNNNNNDDSSNTGDHTKPLAPTAIDLKRTASASAASGAGATTTATTCDGACCKSSINRKSTDSAFEQSTVASTNNDYYRRPSIISASNTSSNNNHYLHPADRQSICSSSTNASSAASCTSASASAAGSPPTFNSNQLRRSLSDMGSQQSVKSDDVISKRGSSSSVPSRQQSISASSPYTKLRRALYNFPGDHDEDLAFSQGDIITVLEEINEGWWSGEVIDKQGHKHCGIFPLNYTEELDTPDVPPPPPPLPSKEDCNLSQESQVHQHVTTTPRPQQTLNHSNTTTDDTNNNDNAPTATTATKDASNTGAPIPNDAGSASQI